MNDSKFVSLGFVVAALLGLLDIAGVAGLFIDPAPPAAAVNARRWSLLARLAVGAVCGLAWSPMLFAAVLLLNPGGLAQFLRDGLGGGALAIPLFGMLGGYAFSRRGPLWTRLLSRVAVLAPIPSGLVLLLVNRPVSAASAWIGLYFYSFIVVLGFACAIPHAPEVGSGR